MELQIPLMFAIILIILAFLRSSVIALYTDIFEKYIAHEANINEAFGGANYMSDSDKNNVNSNISSNNEEYSGEYTIVSLDKLKPFSGSLYDEKGNKTHVKGNPFYVPDDYLGDNDKTGDNEAKKSMRSLHASIEQEGVLTPLLVRPSKSKSKDKGKAKDAGNGDGDTGEEEYEILSGYRRKKVCDVLSETQPKFRQIPVIIVDCDDDDASSIITSANVQRKEISQLETIISCGRMYRALRHRGVRTEKDKDLTVKIVSNVLGLTQRTVIRYAYLLNLPEFLLQLVGNKVKNQNGEKRMPVHAGEILSSVNKAKLDVINKIMREDDDKVITVETATVLRNACKRNPDITDEKIEGIITKANSHKPDGADSAEEPASKRKCFSSAPDGSLTEAINKYCHNMSDQQIDDLLSDLLTKWGDSVNTTEEATTENVTE